MADRYEICIIVKRKDEIKKFQDIVLERTKNLSPSLCKTRVFKAVYSRWPLHEIRIRVTCSWRTAPELDKFLKRYDDSFHVAYIHGVKSTFKLWR